MAVEAQKETRGFETEVKQLLNLMVHALYSNKEVFLRELVSNASDALDKLRFQALGNNKLTEGDSELKVWIEFDKDKRTITVRDNGIGMTRDEVIQHLGTIAKSGTREFLASLTGDQAKDSNLIGQFGVGFYSAFVVADQVTVNTRKAGSDAAQGVRWVSNGEGEYNLETINKTSRGTEIVLHLPKENEEFLDDFRLRNIIEKYSNHIAWPIVMQKEVPVEVEDDEDKAKEGEKSEAPKEQAVTIEEETVNQAKALWTQAKSAITDEQYKEFYKHISHDFQEPMLWSHNHVEGKQEYTSLLYIPSHAPFDMWNQDVKHGLKLFVKRVFIMDDADQFMPRYLRFVKGIVDSADLPLNISREMLQDNKLIETIRKASVKKVLGMLDKIANNDKEQYQKFWNEFGNVMKEGVIEDFANKEQIAKLLRFSTTHDDKSEQAITLEDYVSRMQEGQEKIFYVTAESFNAAKNSPQLEIFRKKGIEVLLLHDRVDEWLATHLSEFEGKHLQSVSKGELDLGKLADEENKEAKEKQETEFADLVKKVKETLGERVSEVRITDRLTDSPACIVVGDYDMGIQLQRMMKAAGQAMPTSKPIFELNPAHPIVKRLHSEQADAQFNDWANILFDQAVLATGGELEDPAEFVKRLNGMLLQLSMA